MEKMKIYDAVRSVPPEAKKEIKGGRLKGMTDINPMWRIKTLTEQFGPCGTGWYYDIENYETIPCGEEAVINLEISLYVKNGDTWSMPIRGFGGSKLIAKEKGGHNVNDEAWKMALTDALSVSCKALGMGADVYWNKDQTKYSNIDLIDQVIAEGAKHGMDANALAKKYKLSNSTDTSRLNEVLAELEAMK